jgi:hypothetical protein
MSQAVVGKKYGIEQTEVSAIQRMQRVKIARLVDDNDKKVLYIGSTPVRPPGLFNRCDSVQSVLPVICEPASGGERHGRRS